MKGIVHGLLGAAAVAARLVLAGAAGLGAAAALVMLLAPGSEALDAVTHFAPLAAAGGLAVFAAAYALRQRGIVLVMAGAACAGAAFTMVPEGVGAAGQALAPRADADAPRLKLLSVNVWKRNHDLDAVESLIRREQPDIIVLIEAADQWRPLIERIADDYAHMAYCTRKYWCNTIILSRLDFVEDITPEDEYAIAAARMRLPPRLGGAVIDVVGVHAAWPWPTGPQHNDFVALARLSQRIDPDWALIAGDFNSTPWSNRLRWLDREIPFPRRTRWLFSWPAPTAAISRFGVRAPFALLPIDHVYAGANWRLVEIRRGPPIGSDHYPVIAVFAPKVTPRPALRGFSPESEAVRP